MRPCKCGETEISNFYVDLHRSSGYSSSCKKCTAQRSRKRYKEKKSDILKYRKSNSVSISSKKREYREKHRQQISILFKKWVQENREHRRKYARYYKALRKAAVLRATPPWLTESQRAEIRNIYETCPKGFHVDHIHPLSGKNSCGLHVPWNLQHLPAEANLKKSNKVA